VDRYEAEKFRHPDSGPRYGFRHPEAVRGRKVLLLDDIFATGKSLTEAARLIREHDPAFLMALTLVKLGRS
jgi:predicted amidophosphoribosyltransferase